MKRNSNLFFWVQLFFGVICLDAREPIKGVIEGAAYEIHMPEEPSGRLLLLAHGYRPESLPLTADVGASSDLYRNLVDQGWIVASSSYRRNGWIFEDAGRDIINLRNFIVTEVYKPEMIYLMGNSMGGGIITWLSENYEELFDGGLAMGAYLFGPIVLGVDNEPVLNSLFVGEPKFPLLYLTNTSELKGPAMYMDFVKENSVEPVLWPVNRFGHVNQNKAEQAAALKALVGWVENGVIDRSGDGTIVVSPQSTAEFPETGRARGIAHTLVPVYGNIISSFVREDIDKLGIELGDQFHLRSGDRTVSVQMGSTYLDVPIGEWVAFWDAEGYLLFCRNYKHAVDSLGVAPDALLEIWK